MKQADEELELTNLLTREAGGLEPALAELRGRLPDATELASLSARLALQGVDMSPASAPTTPSPWRKWLVLGGGGVAAALLWLGLRSGASHAPQVPHAPVATLAPSAQSGLVAAPPAGAAPGGVGQGAPGSAPLSAEPSSVAAAGVAEPGAVAPLQPGEPTVNSAPPAAGVTGVAATPVTRAASPGTPRGSEASPGTPDLPPSSTSAPTEIELLRDARLALKASPARALELAEQHAHLYPGGKLTQERELIAISALVALGRRTAALSRGGRFEQAFPGSPYRKQVGELLR